MEPTNIDPRRFERCDGCGLRSYVWWLYPVTGEDEYGGLKLSTCFHCARIHESALKAKGWTIALDARYLLTGKREPVKEPAAA